MEAKDLMVGDLVRVSGKQIYIEEGTIVRVFGINEEDFLDKYSLKGSAICRPIDGKMWITGGIWCPFLEPIPLTAEILEKNGLRRKEKYEKYEWSEGYVEIWVILGASGEEGEKQNVIHIEDGRRGITKCHHNTIAFVHELQHALRLCGIEKEITL